MWFKHFIFETEFTENASSKFSQVQVRVFTAWGLIGVRIYVRIEDFESSEIQKVRTLTWKEIFQSKSQLPRMLALATLQHCNLLSSFSMHTVCTLPQNVHAFDGYHSCVYVRIRSLPPWTDSWFLKIEFGILRNDLRFVYVRNKIVLMIRFNTKYPSSKFSRPKFTIFATICHIFSTESCPKLTSLGVTGR